MLEQVVPITRSQPNGNHATELSTFGHVNSELRWKGTFNLNCKQLRIEATNTLSQFEICFPPFSETTHTILKKISQRILMQCRQQLLQKK